MHSEEFGGFGAVVMLNRRLAITNKLLKKRIERKQKIQTYGRLSTIKEINYKVVVLGKRKVQMVV